MDINNGEITIVPLWKEPLTIDPLVAKNVRNNRFQIFTDLGSSSKSKVAFDLQKQISINLPPEIANQPVGKVLNYLKKKNN